MLSLKRGPGARGAVFFFARGCRVCGARNGEALKVGKPFDMLTAALEHADPIVASHAARLLGALGDGRATGSLVRYVTESRFYSKAEGFNALARLGQRSACPGIRPLVNEPHVADDWFWYACRAVRCAAAVALLALGDDFGAEYLNELADRDDDVFFCWYAPAILHLADELEATQTIKALITVESLGTRGDRGIRNSEPATLAMKARAAELIATPEAVRLLLELMRFHSRYVRGQAAVSLLLASPTDQHVATVRCMARDDPTEFARLKAALALARTGCQELIPAITQVAESSADDFNRAVAVEALGQLGHKDDFAAVLAQADHADAYVRLCAIEAADRIDRQAAATTAEWRLGDDSDERVRLQAAKLLAACAMETDRR